MCWTEQSADVNEAETHVEEPLLASRNHVSELLGGLLSFHSLGLMSYTSNSFMLGPTPHTQL